MLREIRTILLDLATAPLPNAAEFVDVESIALGNRKDPAVIAAYRAEKLQERVDAAALDLDLAWITGIGINVIGSDHVPLTWLHKDTDYEKGSLKILADTFKGGNYRLISYNGLSFDWPMLMRRARYLGVSFPDINCDRYKSPHVDLLARLSLHDPSRRKSLGFYARRLGMGLTKPLSGAEEAQVPQTGRWAELEASLRHDVEALHKLAVWAGVL
jgi:hypothetical protein